MYQQTPRNLTKSRFKIGLERPIKIYYTGKPQYPDQSMEDNFRTVLAEGKYQVDELAKLHYSGGYDITRLDYDEALEQTNKLLEKDHVILYEAAIKYQNLQYCELATFAMVMIYESWKYESGNRSYKNDKPRHSL